MNLYFDQTIAKKYKSPLQITRVLTEEWVKVNMYCPRCGNSRLTHFQNNKKVADFFCEKCMSEYELKSKRGIITNKIAGSAYNAFIERITSNNNPDFLILTYDPVELCVDNLWIIPKHFFSPSIVEQRQPLPPTARRAGWVGCNILFNKIPQQGRISIIQKRVISKKSDVLANVKRLSMLATHDIVARSWLLDVLNCVNRISSEVFSLSEVYQFDHELKKLHPKNNHVRPKIREQLQVLRDEGLLEFLNRGQYRKKI